MGSFSFYRELNTSYYAKIIKIRKGLIMMRAFKEFWKDYAKLMKVSGEWCKKHWEGYIVLIAAIFGAEMTWFYREDIKDKISDKLESKKSKKGEES